MGFSGASESWQFSISIGMPESLNRAAKRAAFFSLEHPSIFTLSKP
jgi:hypothetical protein